MNWSTVKNLLIAILVGANLFLIFNIARQVRTRKYIDSEMLNDTVSLLGQWGLRVEADAVPAEKFNVPVYESVYNDEYYTVVAQQLSGAKRELLLSLPDGGFSITAENGSTVEFDSEFGFVFYGNNAFKETAYADITADNVLSYVEKHGELKGSEARAAKKKAVSFLGDCFASESVPDIEVVHSFLDEEHGISYVYALQKFDEYYIDSHYAVCVFEKDRLIGAYGRWYFSGFSDAHSAVLNDQINILFEDYEVLKSDTDSKHEADTDGGNTQSEPVQLPSVVKMVSCYVTYWNADKTALYFIPAWKIEHSDGSKLVFNAVNGSVYSKQ